MQLLSQPHYSFPLMATCLQLLHHAAVCFLIATSASVAAASLPRSFPSVDLATSHDVPATTGNANDLRKPSAVNFAIVIPAMLRLLENDHPTSLPAFAEISSPISAQQRVVLVSTMKSGFCMDLRLNPMRGDQAHVADWQVQLAALPNAAAARARVESVDGGWRVCARHAGRFELALQHAFSLQPSLKTPTTNSLSARMGKTIAIDWPVALSLSTP